MSKKNYYRNARLVILPYVHKGPKSILMEHVWLLYFLLIFQLRKHYFTMLCMHTVEMERSGHMN